MMKILVVAATRNEIEPLIESLDQVMSISENEISGIFMRHTIDVLITGVGMSSTAYFIGIQLSKGYDLFINAGLAGTFDEEIDLSDVVVVKSDFFAELGAEDADEFISFDAMNLPGYYSFAELYFENYLSDFKFVHACTVNKVHGNRNSITSFKKRFPFVQIESMEGASCAMASRITQIPFIQIRSISNRVEERNKSNWKIKPAIENLNWQLIKLLTALK